MPPVLLVLCHLRWNFVYQRPQHLMSRLAGRWRVLFVEEPVRCDGLAWLECIDLGPNLQVLVPHTPVAAAGFHDDQLPIQTALLDGFLRQEGVAADVAWLYTPMALPMVASLSPRCVVYDCMDELTAFKHAPRQLRQRESALCKQAHLVLTGGPSLYEAKRHLHANIHCLPSAVDAAHFTPASLCPESNHAREAQALQVHLPRPRLGYYGVIDERLDMGLVAALADARPDWCFVMAGPVVKIDPATLPQRDNLHWLGMQPYDRLPYLLADWDVALMPFALNESTRFISPTKTLEYMAGGKPVVSTPIRDVIDLYGDAVIVADGAEAFIAGCETLLGEDVGARSRRATSMAAAVRRHSWDNGVVRVNALLDDALAQTDEAEEASLKGASAELLRVAKVGTGAVR